MEAQPSGPSFLRQWVLVFFALVGVASLALGFILRGDDFLSSFLSVVGSAAITALIALLVIARYSAIRDAQKWAKIRGITFRAIRAHLSDIAVEVFIYFPRVDHRLMPEIIGGGDNPDPSVSHAIALLATQLQKAPTSISEENEFSNYAVDFYDAIGWDLRQLQNVLIPRAIQCYTSQSVVDSLIRLDDSGRELHNQIAVHKQVVTGGVVKFVVNLLMRSANTYQSLSSQ